LADLDRICTELSDYTSEDLDRICTHQEDQDSHRPRSDQTSAHLHRIGIDLEDRTSEDADSIGIITALSQCLYWDQPSNGATFLLPSPAEDLVLYRPMEHSRLIRNATFSALQRSPVGVAASERTNRSAPHEKPKMQMASLSRHLDEAIYRHVSSLLKIISHPRKPYRNWKLEKLARRKWDDSRQLKHWFEGGVFDVRAQGFHRSGHRGIHGTMAQNKKLHMNIMIAE
jgi:hypothetical protein